MPSLHASARRWCAALGWAALAGACNADLPVEDCRLPCESLCPSGSECRNGYCVRSGSAATCNAVDAGVEAGDRTKVEGSGGTPGVGGASGAGAVSGGDGGQGGARDAGASPSPFTLSITADAPDTACTAEPIRVPLTVSGGRPPYDWKLVGDAAGFSLDAVQGKTVGLLLTPGVGGGSVLVDVRDADGKQGRENVAPRVHETPTVTTTQLPNACIGGAYAALLDARGGDSKAYTWTADAGFTVSGSTLLGTPDQSGTETIHVSVSDGVCTSATVPLTLTIDPTATSSCPSINQPTLPPPCEGESYHAQLTVDRGTPRLTWTVLEIPPGLTFDADQAVLKGTPTASGRFTAFVTDGAGRGTQRSFDLPLRKSCWLGFVSAVGLELADPLLVSNAGIPDSHRVLARDGGVADFAFSPDGQLIAYRSTSDASGSKVHVLAVPNGDEVPFELDGDALSYAWSPDSRVLAVVLQRQGFDYLGGVRLVGGRRKPADAADGGATQPDSGGSLPSAVPLVIGEPDAGPPRLGAAVEWIDSQTVAFIGPQSLSDPGGDGIAEYARLQEDGFGPPVEPKITSHSLPLTQLSAGSGFYVVAWGDQTLDSYVLGQNDVYNAFVPAFLGSTDALPDPEGSYVANVSGGTLQLFTTQNQQSPPRMKPVGTGSRCDSILAWASGAERIACDHLAADAGSDTDINTYELASGPITPNGIPFLAGAHLPYGATRVHRQQFSRTGGYLATTTSTELYLSTIGRGGAQTLTLGWPIPNPYSDPANHVFVPTELAFSPNEKALLLQAGNSLSVTKVDAVSVGLQLSSTAPTFPVCRDTFLPDQVQGGAVVPAAPWCGSPDVTLDARWSSDALAVAGHTGDGITVWNVTTIDQGRVDSGTVVCAACTGQFSFQP